MGKRRLERLSAAEVRSLKEPGRYPDGRGLYLQITPAGVKSWIFRFQRAGIERAMGLGPVYDVSLKDARERARLARVELLDGRDPLEARHEARADERARAALERTFDEATVEFIATKRDEWSNLKHAQQWENSLATYASPVLGPLRVRKIETAHVLAVLQPIWSEKTETATRLRSRIEAVLNWSEAHKFRDGPNPARWAGNLAAMLPAPTKLKKVKHHAALPYPEAPAFMAALRAQEGIAARALELTMLTAGRTNEVLAAEWSEIDVEAHVWSVPAARMKMKREHRVPLSPRAIEIIKALPRFEGSPFLFNGAKKGKPLSNMAMTAVLRRMGRADITVHGFRSTFRDWTAETTDTPSFVAEMALAHAVGDKVEAAYRRGELMEKRAVLMNQWAAFLG